MAIVPPNPTCKAVAMNRSEGSFRREAKCAPPAQKSAPHRMARLPLVGPADAPEWFSKPMPTSPSPTANHSGRVTRRPANAAMIVANSGTVATIRAAEPVGTVRIPNASMPLESPTSMVPTSAALRISAAVGQMLVRRAAKINSPRAGGHVAGPRQHQGRKRAQSDVHREISRAPDHIDNAKRQRDAAIARTRQRRTEHGFSCPAR